MTPADFCSLKQGTDVDSLKGERVTVLGHQDALVFGEPCSLTSLYYGKRHWDISTLHKKPFAGLWQGEALEQIP